MSDINKIRHSLAHILALSVQELYPDIKFGIGPAIENGFYYDFDLPKDFSSRELPKIEEKMRKLAKKDISFEKKDVSKKEAQKIFADQPYKLELLDEIQEEKISTYETGGFTDLCSGPHIKSSGEIPTDGFKLDKIAGAYWRGKEKNPMLTRIYGFAFENKKELESFLKMRDEAEKRDHRKIGKESDLFSFHPAAPGDVFWHSKGYTIFKELTKYWREIHDRKGYIEVRTPEILTREIWDQSGHTSNFLEKMYRVLTPEVDEWDMAVKPMNCDGGMLIYRNRPRSYREFPIKMGELGVVHRYESSGETHGLMRVREFTQDDAHIYCTPEQVKDELKKVIDLCFEIYETCGLEVDRIELSTRPENSIGSDKVWERAEAIMREVLKEKDTPYKINEGDGAFYGPKFDFHLKDAIGRTWQCGTIQLDFAQPENFDLEYTTKQGTKERPVMIHRTIYGSLERFIGILIENYAGAFPLWLAPEQIWILPIGENHKEYAQKTAENLKNQDLRVLIRNDDNTLSKKVREGEMQKIPYLLVIGDEEVKNQEVSVRHREKGDIGKMDLKKFAERALKEVKSKTI